MEVVIVVILALLSPSLGADDDDGSYKPDDSGRYVPDNSGKYIPDYSGSYVHEGSGRYSGDRIGRYRGDGSGRFSGDKLGGGRGGQGDFFPRPGTPGGFGSGGRRPSGSSGKGGVSANLLSIDLGSQNKQSAALSQGNFGRSDGAGYFGNRDRQDSDFGNAVSAATPQRSSVSKGFGSSGSRFSGSNYDSQGRYSNDGKWKIIRQTSELEGDGYHWQYETENGISAEESGKVANKGSNNEAMRAQGFYQYTGPDNVLYYVQYTADENGFVPQGNHLPTPPPIPEAILRSLQFQKASFP